MPGPGLGLGEKATMQGFRRYAMYWAPSPGAWEAAAAEWLGWNPATGKVALQPDLQVPLAVWTEEPRKYGFHGTVKAPFRLAEGWDRDRLSAFGLDKSALRLACPCFAGRTVPAPDRLVSGFDAGWGCGGLAGFGRRGGRRAGCCACAVDRGGSAKTPARAAVGGSASIFGPLGLSLCHGGIPVPLERVGQPGPG